MNLKSQTMAPVSAGGSNVAAETLARYSLTSGWRGLQLEGTLEADAPISAAALAGTVPPSTSAAVTAINRHNTGTSLRTPLTLGTRGATDNSGRTSLATPFPDCAEQAVPLGARNNL